MYEQFLESWKSKYYFIRMIQDPTKPLDDSPWDIDVL
jgi:hypothetical protein